MTGEGQEPPVGLLLHPTPLFTQRGLPNIPCSQTAVIGQLPLFDWLPRISRQRQSAIIVGDHCGALQSQSQRIR